MILRASKPVCEESTEVDMVPDSEPGPVYGLLRDSRVWKYLLPTLLKIVCYLAHAFARCRGNGVLMDTPVFINTLMC